MKKLFFISLCIIAMHNAFGQLQTGFHYKIKNSYHPFLHKDTFPLTIYYTSDSGRTKRQKVICRRKSKLKANVLQDEKDPTILKIDFWAIDSSDFGCQRDTNTINSSVLLDDRHYYYLKVEKRRKVGIPTKYISLPYRTIELGVTAIPFKYRFGHMKDSIPNDASSNISAGIYVGKKWGRTRFFQDKTRTMNSLSYTLAVFASPTVIALSSDDTKNKTKIKSNELGLGYGIALMISYGDINLGLLAGIDTPLSTPSSQWFYANRPWIGFGVGYKLAILNAGK